MRDIVEFLRARLDEDEATAMAAVPGPWRSSIEGRDHLGGDCVILTDGGHSDLYISLPGEDTSGFRLQRQDATQDHIARHDPARVLAEVKAKRAVIEYELRYRTVRPTTQDGWGVSASQILRAMAEPYSDHPDYGVWIP